MKEVKEMGKGQHEKKESGDLAAGDAELNDVEDEVTHLPDGGWGWMVVFSSFVVHVIADGIVYSFGVFFIEFLHYFKGGKGETAWVGSLVPAVTYSVGPLASALTNRYGCRVVTMLGAVIAALGFIISLFAPNIYYLYFSFGIMAGVGFGLIYLPAIVCVSNYFEKKRSFATGLAVCGSGFGTFIFAPFSKWLVDTYTWKGAVLIQGGLILNIVICGALFRPLEVPEEKEEILMKKLEKEASDLEKSNKAEKKTGPEKVEELKELLTEKSSAIYRPRKFAPHLNAVALSNSHHHLHVPKSNGTITNSHLARSEGAIHKVSYSNSISNLHHIRYQRQNSHGSTLVHPMMRKDVFYQASLQNIPMFKSHPDLYISSVVSLPESLADDTEWKFCNCCKPSLEFRDTIHQMLDLSLLKDPVFVMFAISNFFTSIGFNMPFIYIPDRALEAGIGESQAAFLLSVIGIANTIGRVLFGWLSDRQEVNRLMLYNTALTICGVATALSPFCGGSYPWLVAYCAVFGLFIGVYVSLTSVVLVDLLGLDKLTNSFGLLLLFQGAATFIGPPMAGWMYDWTGSYDISFNVNGSVIALSGIMLYFIPVLIRHRGKHQAVSTVQEINIEDGEVIPPPESLGLRERTISV